MNDEEWENERVHDVSEVQCCSRIGRLRQMGDDLKEVIERERPQGWFLFQGMTCLEVEYGNEKGSINLCSLDADQVESLRTHLLQQVYRLIQFTYLHNTELNFLVDSVEHHRLALKNKRFLDWDFTEQEQYPKECQSSWNKLKSPININNAQINKVQEYSGGQKADLSKLLVVDTGLQYYNSQGDMINAESFDKDHKLSHDQDGYLRHPVYTYYGVHESILLGYLGSFKLTTPMASSETGHSVCKYQAFGMRFKMPGEHVLDGQQIDLEIQVLMTLVAKDDQDLSESNGESLDSLNLLIGIQEGMAYKQFAIGHNPADSLEAEEHLNQATDLILSIPMVISMDVNQTQFWHYLLHEPWFDTQPISIIEEYSYSDGQQYKIISKDIEPPSLQERKRGDLDEKAEEAYKHWEDVCRPGSVQCLLQTSGSTISGQYYIYDGSNTNPPCDKQVKWVVMAQPLDINRRDYNDLKQNLFLFRDSSINSNHLLTNPTDLQVLSASITANYNPTAICNLSVLAQMQLYLHTLPQFSSSSIDQTISQLTTLNSLYDKSINSRKQNYEWERTSFWNELKDLTEIDRFIFSSSRFERRRYAQSQVMKERLIESAQIEEMPPILEAKDKDSPSLVYVSADLKHEQLLSASSRQVSRIQRVINYSNERPLSNPDKSIHLSIQPIIKNQDSQYAYQYKLKS